MADCKYIEACPFFNEKLPNMPAMTKLIKKQYCHGNFTECARLIAYEATGIEVLPNTMYPNDSKAAQAFIQEHQKK
ncbi:MAG: hypothetical protein D6675_01560 [Gemmatimonadetes bacterium]|nr:MAG: hypothetical protein D6675_01560 [Gemmatimonadota bacterium]